MKRILFYLCCFVFFYFFATAGVPYIRQILLSTGYIQEEITIAGTGSMYPTFPKGEGETDVIRAQETVAWPKMRTYPSGINLFGWNAFTYKIRSGDIVEINSQKTREISKAKYGEEAGFVKRVIAVPGDTIELRDGYVSINGKVLNEPYTAKPRSTYGGDVLPDCKAIKIPDGKYFVMGDNRKASFDSRYDLGLINDSDIHYVLPWPEQEEYRLKWRDTSKDSLLANTTTLEPEVFVTMLNAKRKEKNLPALIYKPGLSASAKIRGTAMIKFDDFSTEASKSGVTLEKSIRQSGYRNILFAEVFTRGFYDADELLDNFLEFPNTKELLFSKQYQDIGLSPVLGSINGCPVEVVVANLGGYVPPNYKPSDSQSWDTLIKNIESVLPSWEAAKNAESIDQQKLNRLITILQTRLSRAKQVVSKIKKNEWLTDEEIQWTRDDKSLGEEAQKIIGELNNK